MTDTPSIDLRLLNYFVVVAEELNFARAAERLHISQPPLTRQIKQLEEELKLQLFERTTRVVRLTPAGEIYLAATRKLFAQMRNDVATVKRAARGELGEIVIGFEASTANDLLPRALHAFRNSYPDVKLTLQEMPTDDQVNALLERKIGVAFVVPPISAPEIEHATVLREPLVLAMPSKHHLKGRQSVALKELSGEAFIMSSRDIQCGLHNQVIAICGKAGFHPRVVQEANEIQIMLSFISAGIGVSLLPAHVKDLNRRGIAYLPVTPDSATIDVAIAWRKDDHSPALERFLAIVKEQSES